MWRKLRESRTAGEEKGVGAFRRPIRNEAIQIIQMLNSPLPCPPPPSPPRVQLRVFSVLQLWCQRASLKALTRSFSVECSRWAQWPKFEYHSDICQPLTPTKEKGVLHSFSTMLLFYWSRKFVWFVYVFCGVLWSFENSHERGSAPSCLKWPFRFCLSPTDIHGLGQPLPRQVRPPASHQGPADRRDWWRAAGWSNTSCR